MGKTIEGSSAIFVALANGDKISKNKIEEILSNRGYAGKSKDPKQTLAKSRRTKFTKLMNAGYISREHYKYIYTDKLLNLQKDIRAYINDKGVCIKNIENTLNEISSQSSKDDMMTFTTSYSLSTQSHKKEIVQRYLEFLNLIKIVEEIEEEEMSEAI